MMAVLNRIEDALYMALTVLLGVWVYVVIPLVLIWAGIVIGYATVFYAPHWTIELWVLGSLGLSAAGMIYSKRTGGFLLPIIACVCFIVPMIATFTYETIHLAHLITL